MRRIITITLVVIFPFFGKSQNTIKGRIVNDSGNPLPGCNVFVNNTHKGTSSDVNGNFVLNNIPKGQHELIISSIGYETTVFPFFEEQLPLDIKVELLIKAKELQNVTVSSEPHTVGGWAQYGFMFMNGFIGNTPNAEKCKIKNKETLVFHFYERSQRLRAFANEPLIIENHALGYIINYQLEEFEMNLEKGSTSYLGYTMFTEMDPKNKNEEKKWAKNRLDTYSGSLMHFLRTVYRNRFSEEGFEVRRMVRIINKEKTRVKSICNDCITYKLLPNGSRIPELAKGKPSIPRDSLYYYSRVLNQQDSLLIPGTSLLTADSIITMTSDGFPALRFEEKILVIFRKPAIKNQQGIPSVSYLELAPGTSVSVDEQGYYFDSRDLYASGAWGYSERASNFLPQDFNPDQELKKDN